MASRLNPYISFDGDAREAMRHYEKVFGGTLEMHTFGDYEQTEGVDPDKIMHAQLETPSGFTLMGADTPPGMEHRPGTNFAVSLGGDDAEELHRYWDALCDGGRVTVPLERQMWGDEFGQCVDRFGVSWMVNIAGSSG